MVKNLYEEWKEDDEEGREAKLCQYCKDKIPSDEERTFVKIGSTKTGHSSIYFFHLECTHEVQIEGILE